MQPVGDVLVLAGDVVTFRGLTKARGFFDFVCDHYAAVYWVPANHEYYGSDISDRPSPLLEWEYRVNSKRGTQFRIWANKILKDYLINGYALNEKRLNETT